jgi:hypothetical protein
MISTIHLPIPARSCPHPRERGPTTPRHALARRNMSTSSVSLLSDESLREHPYVSIIVPRTSKPTAPIFRAIKNAPIFALGVALLEILHGRRLHTFATPDNLDASGNRTSWTDYLIADGLVESINARELPNFANAVRRCVHCTFESSAYSLHDEGFREKFYQDVIVPLKNDYGFAMGC